MLRAAVRCELLLELEGASCRDDKLLLLLLQLLLLILRASTRLLEHLVDPVDVGEAHGTCLALRVAHRVGRGGSRVTQPRQLIACTHRLRLR